PGLPPADERGRVLAVEAVRDYPRHGRQRPRARGGEEARRALHVRQLTIRVHRRKPRQRVPDRRCPRPLAAARADERVVVGALACPYRFQGPRTPSIWNPLPWFSTVHADRQLANVQSSARFFAAARAGTLP